MGVLLFFKVRVYAYLFICCQFKNFPPASIQSDCRETEHGRCGESGEPSCFFRKSHWLKPRERSAESRTTGQNEKEPPDPFTCFCSSSPFIFLPHNSMPPSCSHTAEAEGPLAADIALQSSCTGDRIPESHCTSHRAPFW